jgi:hypothetical protein
MITPVETAAPASGAQPSWRAARRSTARAGEAGLAGAGVGDAGVDDQRADAAAGVRREVLAADLHRRGAEAVLREHAGDAAPASQTTSSRSRRLALRMPAWAMPRAHAGNGQQFGGVRGAASD